MRTYRLVLASAVGAVLVAACTSAGGGAYGGGVYGGGGASSQPVVVAASSAATPLATEAASGAASGGYGGGKGDYGTGGGSPVAVASAVPGAVRLSGFAFEPTTMTAAAGTTLTFANDDGVAHDIVEGTDGAAASRSAVHARLAPGATASVTLPKAGTLALTCTIHPSMNMTVTVTP